MAPSPDIAPIETFLACVHCGLCLSSCPTYLETGGEADSPRGRIHLMRALQEGRVTATAPVLHHLDLCLGCRACETACPSGVEYGRLIEGARRALADAPRPWLDRWRRRSLARLLPHPSRLRPAALLLRVLSPLGRSRLATRSWLPLRLRRLVAMIPEARPERSLPEVLGEAEPKHGTVALLTGCVGRMLFSDVNQRSVLLLARAGYRVLVPRVQGCCGALLAHLGDGAEAERLARTNTNAFLRVESDWIATNAAGCGAMMREYGRVLRGDPRYADAASRVSAKVRDVTELLAAGSLPRPSREVRARVAYHDACHLAHGQGVRRQPRALLRSIPGLELVELADSELCCGSAGTYNLTEPAMAWRLGERKARAILDTGATMVAAANPGCLLQIQAALRVAGRDLPVVHPVDLLARAHGIG